MPPTAMLGKRDNSLQFTMSGILRAVTWVGLAMMLYQVYWRLDNHNGVEYSPEIARLSLSLMPVPIGGLIGALFRRPIDGVLAGIGIWFAILTLLVVMALLP